MTASIINDILAFRNITVTEAELKDLLNTPSFLLRNLDSKKITRETLKNKLGSPYGKQKVPGIYIFTHLTTGRKYVGSSVELASRLNSYICLRYKASGLLIPLLKKEKFQNFSLQVFPLRDKYKPG